MIKSKTIDHGGEDITVKCELEGNPEIILYEALSVVQSYKGSLISDDIPNKEKLWSIFRKKVLKLLESETLKGGKKHDTL